MLAVEITAFLFVFIQSFQDNSLIYEGFESPNCFIFKIAYLMVMKSKGLSAFVLLWRPGMIYYASTKYVILMNPVSSA